MTSFAAPLPATGPAGLALERIEGLLDLAFGQRLNPARTQPPGALAAGTLAAMPFASRIPRAPAARVNLDQCNGCARCFADCPFGAVTMVPRSDGRPHPREARVDPALCAGCGICTGASPSSTPFRRGEALATGIDMPSLAIGAARAALEDFRDHLRRLPPGAAQPGLAPRRQEHRHG